MYEMIISSIASDFSVGVFCDKKLRYFYREDHKTRSLVGSIYYGVVLRVLPGTQSAFVDIGQGRSGFLHIKDCVLEGQSDKKIEDLVVQGQHILVQVLKDAIGTKGPRLTTQLALPSVYCVYHPYQVQSSLSQKISDFAEQSRLQSLLRQHHMRGVILRTLCEGVCEDVIVKDYQESLGQWEKIRNAALKAETVPVCLWRDLSLVERIVRDFTKFGISCIFVNNSLLAESLEGFIHRHCVSEVRPRVIYKPAGENVAASYEFSSQLLAAIRPQIDLKSGGAVIIEQTESMVTIDVNTSAFIGKRNVKETVFKTNQEAISVLAQQIPLRELGGIIIVDFIDMPDLQDRAAIYEQSQKAFFGDIMPVQVYPLTPLGLLQMTRKRQGQSYLHKNTIPCPCCGALGKLIAPHMFLWVFLEKYDCIVDREDKVLVILGRKDVLEYLKRYEKHLRVYKNMTKMIWRYEPTHNHDNQIDLRVVSKSDFYGSQQDSQEPVF